MYILVGHPIPDTPNSSLLSMSGQNMIEMTFPPRHLSHRANERVTRTVGIQAGGVCLCPCVVLCRCVHVCMCCVGACMYACATACVCIHMYVVQHAHILH